MDEATKAAIEAVAKQLPVDKAYDDVAHGALTEAGEALTDTVKVARLFLAPVQYIAAWQDRFARYCKRIADKVPEARRIEAAPMIAGPVLEALRFADEQALATELMLDLLASAMDSERVQHVHPAFAGLAVQLSSDEALILFYLKKNAYVRVATEETPIVHHRKFEGPRIVSEEPFPRESLAFPQHFHVYMSHLESLALVHYTRYPAEVHGSTNTYKEIATTTHFGRMFVNAL